MKLEKQKTVLLSVYPFLDDAMAYSCLEHIHQAGEHPLNLNKELARRAFDLFSCDLISNRFPNLHSWQVKSICDRLLSYSTSSQNNCFADPEAIDKAHDESARLPTSSDEINEILIGLKKEHNIDLIRAQLLKIIIYIRVEKKSLHSSKTTEGDNVVANIEQNLIGLLNTCTKKGFYEIYSRIRELAAIAPKTDVFGINITELRDNVAFYHENHSEDSPFYAIAEEVREAVHRRLSGEVIKLINDLVSFLKSDMEYRFISGRYCQATREEKDAELRSDVFAKLLMVRDQLKLIWNDPFSENIALFTSNGKVREKREYLVKAINLIEKITEPSRDIIKAYDNVGFLDQLRNTIQALENENFSEMNLGPTRYSLNMVILDLAGSRKKDKGLILLNLMTLDSVLENLSLVYYSNIVNSDLATIDDSNFHKAIRTLPDLVLCTRATGQGTKLMRRMALTLKESIEDSEEIRKVEVQSHIREMNEELVGYIYKLTQSINDVLETSRQEEQFDDSGRVHTQLLNDMIREKTTHLCGNLLSSMGRFLGGEGSEATRELAKSKRHLQLGSSSKEISLEKVVFRFGPDVERISHIEENVWLMGGKGASQAEMSRLVVENELKGVDVPKGFGLSTQTWPLIRQSEQKQKVLEKMIFSEIRALENRTGKALGEPTNPLLLVARSGAVISLPGILPTIAHIGLNDEIAEKWANTLHQPSRAYHAYIRFLFNYSEVVFSEYGVTYETIYKGLGARRVAELFSDNIDEMKKTIVRIKDNIENSTGGLVVPDNCYEQLFVSVIQVLSSYDTDEVMFRHKELKSIPYEYQTACLIQDCLPILEDSDCSGVNLTRNPLDGGEGQIEFIHDFGEDLAGGRVRPGSSERFGKAYPIQNKRLEEIGKVLEKKYASPMDIEFSIRHDKLYIIQTRPLKLAPMAFVVTNYKNYLNGLMSESELIRRTRGIVGHPLINTFMEEIDKQKTSPLAFGQPIAGGVVAGRIIYDVKKIEEYPGEKIIFITKSNVPREVTTQPGIDGYISEEGGVTSHAALVSIGRLPCIVGVQWQKFGKSIVLGEKIEIEQGDVITLDANDGYIYKGKLPIQASPENSPEYLEAEAEIMNIIKRIEEYTFMPQSPIG